MRHIMKQTLRYSLEEIAAAQKTTLTPRITYATSLLVRALDGLKEARLGAARRSKAFKQHNDMLYDAVCKQRLLALAYESARGAHDRLRSAQGIGELASSIPIVIPVIRAAGSQAHTLAPECSSMLCEAASVLGSVAIDAALMSGAKIGYRECARDSARMLECSKLIVDSKLYKLYPKLDFSRLGSIWA